MSFALTIRSISSLDHDGLVLLARERAENGEPIDHDLEPTSPAAIAYEHAYRERQKQLDEQDA